MRDPRSAEKRHDPKWLRYRFELMDRYAIPAIANQREKQFHWIWEVAPETPSPILQDIERKANEAGAQIALDRKWYPDEAVILSALSKSYKISRETMAAFHLRLIRPWGGKRTAKRCGCRCGSSLATNRLQ